MILSPSVRHRAFSSSIPCAAKMLHSYLGRRCEPPRDLVITLIKLPVSKIPTFNHTFYLISYLIPLSMAPIRRSNRAPKPRVYWDPTIIPPRRGQPSAFTIYIEPPEDPSIPDNNLSIQLSAQFHKSL